MSLENTLLDFCHINSNYLNEQQKKMIDSVLFIRMYEELITTYIKEQKRYLRLIKNQGQTDHMIIDAKIVQFITKDILHSGEYTLAGLAYYTDTPQDIIHEIVVGSNISPSLSFSRRIFELHRTIKPQLYRTLMKQVMECSE